MKVFVDASAMVAVIAGEEERTTFIERLRRASARLWSPMSCWEAVSALQNTYKQPVESARERLKTFSDDFALSLVTIGPDELNAALDAYQMYGKGRHRAALNFGDCFAYACAKTNDARLLYKGADFAHTDLA